MSRINHSLFEGGVDHEALPDCPQCGASLTVKHSKSGPFLGCSNYPTCKYTKPLIDKTVEVLKDIDDADCPECDSGLQIKKGRFGLFIGCSAYPNCNYIAPSKDNTETAITCPSCGEGQLVEKTNRYGKRFFSCTRYPDCRYVVNFTPISSPCPSCGWSILIKKAGKLHCPQRTCRYSRDDESN